MAKRVTQQDVAAKCGVHRATVSYALKNHPSIPLKTREKVQKVARRLGYVPDAMLSSLAAYRGRMLPERFRGTLAWIVRSDEGYNWRTRSHFVRYFEGARAASKRHGFNLDLFNVTTTPGGPARVAEIMRARNITGLLLCPQPKANSTFSLPWQDFSAVTFGYTLTNPMLHTVAATQFRGMALTVQQMQARGYRRIGLILQSTHHQRSDNNYLGGFLAQQFVAGVEQIVPPLFVDLYDNVEAIGRWFRKFRPDAIVTGDHRFLEKAEHLGLRVPERIGAACAVLPNLEGRMSGMCEDCFHIGEVAVDFLVAMIQRGERGVPTHQQRVHVEGIWVEGESLRPAGQIGVKKRIRT